MAETDSYKGIPARITLPFAREWMAGRVSEKRLRHVAAAARVARELSLKAKVDPFLSELAAWLHDACKEVKDKKLVEMAEESGLKLHPLERVHGHLLHGPVAAQVVREELGIKHKDLLAAISEHTLGAAPMSPLSEIMFLSDCIDETRPDDYTTPIKQALDMDGTLDVNKAIVVACNLGLKHVIDEGRPIHPRTIEVRNYYLALVQAAAKTQA